MTCVFEDFFEAKGQKSLLNFNVYVYRMQEQQNCSGLSAPCMGRPPDL